MLLERAAFADLTIEFDGRVLRPRPWTALQSRWGAELLAQGPQGPVLELCAGAGQIGLLTIARDPRPLVMVDSCEIACAYAESNAAKAGLSGFVEVRRSRIHEAVAPDERFALIQADPPWVRHYDVDRYPEDPLTAIDGGQDGLDIAWECLAVISRHLLPGGAALLQLGSTEQAAAVHQNLPPQLKIVDVEICAGQGVVVQLADQSALRPNAASRSV